MFDVVTERGSGAHNGTRSIDAGNIPDMLGWDSAMLKSLRLIFPISDGGSLIVLIKMGKS
jgi:hypothetical protein